MVVKEDSAAVGLMLVLLAMLAVAFMPAARAATPEADISGWSVYLDNDALSPLQGDRDYTGGGAVTMSGTEARDFLLAPDPLLGWVDSLFGLEHEAGGVERHRLHSLQLGMIAFTPKWLGDGSGVKPGERPYASLLYLASGRAYAGEGEFKEGGADREVCWGTLFLSKAF